ncbi:MAG: hypothetical protein PVG72_13940 [Gammaproteobacteria bacterium]|jgi:hypothetical protein
MDTVWSELQADGIEVEDLEVMEDEFNRLFGGERTPRQEND